MNTGDWVKAVRRQAKLTQETLSLELGVTKAAISGWENGRYLPNVTQIQRMVALGGMAFPGMTPRERSANDLSELNRTISLISPKGQASLKRIIVATAEGRLSETNIELLAKFVDSLNP